jgi:uncharacterized membrane protein
MPSVAHFKKPATGALDGIFWGIWIESLLFLEPAKARVDI